MGWLGLTMFENAGELADYSPVKRKSVVLRCDFVLFEQKLGLEKNCSYFGIFWFEIGSFNINLSYFIVNNQESKQIVTWKDDFC